MQYHQKFEIAKYFTEVNYAQGLFIHLTNERWLKKLPADVRETLLKVIAEESADTRKRTRVQQNQQIAAAKTAGVTFYQLTPEQKQTLVDMAAPVYKRWEEKIGADYLAAVRQQLGE